MICGSDGILAKPTNDSGKIANGSCLTDLHTPACSLPPPGPGLLGGRLPEMEGGLEAARKLGRRR
jgi:hypothetical protein